MNKKQKPIDKLDIYVEIQSLMKLIYKMQFQLNKSDRNACYPFIFELCLKMSSDIAKARRCKEMEYISLQEMIGHFEELKMMLRIMIDMNILNSESYKINIFNSIAAIDRNLDKWYSYKSDQVNKKLMHSTKNV